MTTLQKFYLANLYTPENNARLATLQHALIPAFPDIVQLFYSELLDDEASQQFLSSHMAETRLKQELERWLAFTLSPKTSEEAQRAVEIQRHVGTVHARINVPMSIVDSAMMMVKNGCFRALLADLEQIEEVYEAVVLVNSILEASLSLINEAFLHGLVENERNAQSFRSHISSHELILEVERVRTDLFNWLSETTLDVMSGSELKPGNLRKSDFALWITHKLELVCSDSQSSQKIKQLLVDAEQTILDTTDTSPREICLTLNKQVNDIAWQLSEISREVAHEAERIDSLTQLIDRKYLASVMQKETHLVMMGQSPYAVIMLDIDHFKSINDNHGHQAGDLVLSQVGPLLKKSVRISDYCFRYGGEEFMVLLPECSANQAYGIAEKFRKTLNKAPLQLDDNQTLNVTASIGVAEFIGHPDFMKTISAADKALYAAKHQGRNQTVLSFESASAQAVNE